MIQTVMIIILGYCLGSILFGEFFLKKFKHKDIRRESSDGNPGTFNAFASGGFLCGSLTLLCDILKGMLPVLLYLHLNHGNRENALLALVMCAPVLGHAFPLYTGFFGGGKAIAVSFGVLLGFVPDLRPVLILAVFYILFSAMRIQPHARRSILTFFCSMVAFIFFVREAAIKMGMFLISLLVIEKHLAKQIGGNERIEQDIPNKI